MGGETSGIEDNNNINNNINNNKQYKPATKVGDYPCLILPRLAKYMLALSGSTFPQQ